MLRCQSFALTLAVFALLSLVNGHLVHSDELISPNTASQLGLTQAWTGAVRSPFGAQSISDIHLHVHQTDPHEYLEIIHAPAGGSKEAMMEKTMMEKKEMMGESGPGNNDDARVLQRIWVNQKDIAGQPLGKAEARRIASNQIRRLKRRGISATTREVTIQRVSLFSLSSYGALECRNAENGNLIWSTRVGDRNLHFRQLGVDDTYVTVINGSNLILVDVNNGEVIQEHPLNHTPIFGAVNSGKYAMVATLKGPVESYDLTDFDSRPYYESASGRAITAPVRSPDSSRVGWTTDKGFFYCMELDGTPSILFRLNTDGIVGGRPAVASGDRFFFGSNSGQVYGVRATRSGDVLWSSPFGESFYAQPMLVGNALFIPSTYGNLFAIDATSGNALWERPTAGVKEVVGAFGDQLFVIMISNNLGIVNLQTGQRINEFNIQPAKVVLNHKTNRIYLIDQRARIQCLRPENAELPTFTLEMEAALDKEMMMGKEMMEAKPERSSGGPPPPTTPGENPFGADEDPFGAGESDPFGGDDEDPFGSGDDDPFGTDEDPFG